jgi:hypothetical protein
MIAVLSIAAVDEPAGVAGLSIAWAAAIPIAL